MQNTKINWLVFGCKTEHIECWMHVGLFTLGKLDFTSAKHV